jgi:hypothetical protein
MDVATFRSILPEFGDTGKYPDARIQFYLDLAYDSLPPAVWGDRLDAATLYYAAHYLTLAVPGMAAPGGQGGYTYASPGLATGPVASKGVGGVSVSFDTSTGQSDGAGAYNLTRYGQIFWSLLAPAATGARQL